MRYLLKPEADFLFSHYGFAGLAMGEWITYQQAGSDSWNVYFIGKV